MDALKKELSELYDLWQESREVTAILNESWASLIRGRRNFFESALRAGISTGHANELYALQLESAQKEYGDAFTRMCELSDEYIVLKMKSKLPTKNFRENHDSK